MSKITWIILGLLLGFGIWKWCDNQQSEIQKVSVDAQARVDVQTEPELTWDAQQRLIKKKKIAASLVPRRTRRNSAHRQQDEASLERDWSDETEYQPIEVDKPIAKEVSLLTDEAVAMFKFLVPPNAKTIRLAVDELPARISMFGVSGVPLTGPNDATDVNPGEETVIAVSRFDYLSPLQAGWFYLVVVVNAEDAESLVETGIESVEISVNASVNLARVDGQLNIGKKISSELGPESGCYRTFELEVPEEVQAVRIDLDRSNADLDIAVRRDRQILETDNADGFATELESRETLVLSREHFGDLSQGKWFVDVYSAFNESYTEFDVYVTEGTEAPAALLALPDLDLETTPAENAMLATVQLGTQTGSASGTIVSSEGLILTNYHVISEADQYARLLNDESESEVVIAISTNPSVPPIEYFRGKVIEKSVKDDLALVKITSGYYGQLLPDGYKFPHVSCRCPSIADLGADIRICGYPVSGAVENNATFSVSSGVLSGFLDGRYLKTDADIASGNSGGGAFDDQWRLIGVPTMTIEDSDGAGPTMGIMMSLDLVPDSWGIELTK